MTVHNGGTQECGFLIFCGTPTPTVGLENLGFDSGPKNADYDFDPKLDSNSRTYRYCMTY